MIANSLSCSSFSGEEAVVAACGISAVSVLMETMEMIKKGYADDLFTSQTVTNLSSPPLFLTEKQPSLHQRLTNCDAQHQGSLRNALAQHSQHPRPPLSWQDAQDPLFVGWENMLSCTVPLAPGVNGTSQGQRRGWASSTRFLSLPVPSQMSSELDCVIRSLLQRERTCC
jgi:hypothetical protein